VAAHSDLIPAVALFLQIACWTDPTGQPTNRRLSPQEKQIPRSAWSGRLHTMSRRSEAWQS